MGCESVRVFEIVSDTCARFLLGLACALLQKYWSDNAVFVYWGSAAFVYMLYLAGAVKYCRSTVRPYLILMLSLRLTWYPPPLPGMACWCNLQ